MEVDPQSKVIGPPEYRAHRGVAFWSGGQNASLRLLFGKPNGHLITLNTKPGAKVPEFGNEGEVNLRAEVADQFPEAIYAETSPPAIYHDMDLSHGAQAK